MLKLSIPLAGALLCIYGLVQAQTPVDLALAQPGSTVPPVIYRSVFPATAATQGGVETAATGWAKANAEVGQFTRGHRDILQAEAASDVGQPSTAGSAGHAHPPGHQERP